MLHDALEEFERLKNTKLADEEEAEEEDAAGSEAAADASRANMAGESSRSHSKLSLAEASPDKQR